MAGNNDLRRMIAQAPVITLPSKRWRCPACGHEPKNLPSPPFPPGTPEHQTVTTEDAAGNVTVTMHCLMCYLGDLRARIPQLVPQEP